MLSKEELKSVLTKKVVKSIEFEYPRNVFPQDSNYQLEHISGYEYRPFVGEDFYTPILREDYPFPFAQRYKLTNKVTNESIEFFYITPQRSSWYQQYYGPTEIYINLPLYSYVEQPYSLPYKVNTEQIFWCLHPEAQKYWETEKIVEYFIGLGEEDDVVQRGKLA